MIAGLKGNHPVPLWENIYSKYFLLPSNYLNSRQSTPFLYFYDNPGIWSPYHDNRKFLITFVSFKASR